MLTSTMKSEEEKTTKTISVVIVEDYKLTRVGLRSTINEFEEFEKDGCFLFGS